MRETLGAINHVFARHGEIAIAVTRNPYTRKPVVTVTDTYVRIPVVPAKKVTQQAIMRLLPELEEAVGRLYSKRLKLRFGKNPFCLEVPLPTPRYTPLSLDDTLPPFHAQIGRAFVYGKAQTVTFNLADSNTAHVFVAGMVGCGKSNVLESYLLSLTYATSPAELRIYSIDMKGRSLALLHDLPHVVAAASTEQAAEQVCRAVMREMERRKQQASPVQDRVLLIIDELRELKFADASLLQHDLPRIIALGRELGIHVVAATQKPSAADLGPLVNALFPVRVIGVVEDAKASYNLLKQTGARAEALIGKGDMLVSRIADDALRMQAFLVQDKQALVQQIQDKWQHVPRPSAFTTQDEDTEEMSDASVSDAIPDAVRRVFWEHYDDAKGKLRHGGMKRVAQALYGEHVSVQGHIHRELTRLCAVLANEPKPTMPLSSSPA